MRPRHSAELLLDCNDQGGLGAVGVPVSQVLDVTPHKIVHGVAISTAVKGTKS